MLNEILYYSYEQAVVNCEIKCWWKQNISTVYCRGSVGRVTYVISGHASIVYNEYTQHRDTESAAANLRQNLLRGYPQ